MNEVVKVQNQFEPLDVIKESWRKVKGSKGALWAIFAIGMLIGIPQSVLNIVLKHTQDTWLAYTLITAGYGFSLLKVIIFSGFSYLGVQIAKDEKLEATEAMAYCFNIKLILKIIGYHILWLLIMVPVILVFINPFSLYSYLTGHEMTAIMRLMSVLLYFIVIPGFIYLQLRLVAAKSILLVEQLNPWAAVKKSFHLTKGNVGNLLALQLLNVFIILGGILTLGIGFIWIIPYNGICQGMIYKKLQEIKFPVNEH